MAASAPRARSKDTIARSNGAPDLTRLALQRPFLKWAGGKGQLLESYLPQFPVRINRYFEPFLGSGAVFFALRSTGRLDGAEVLLSDSNTHLVNCFTEVRSRVDDVIALLREHQSKHSREYYYEQRSLGLEHGRGGERAARFIYLNRTCFNGLFRVNRAGRFNVPMGRYSNPTICDDEGLRAASRSLAGVDISKADYVDVLATTTPGDFVYCDPPYEPLSRTSSFTSYTSTAFGQLDQRALRDAASALTSRGVAVAISNSSATLIDTLYGLPFHKYEVLATRAINSKASKRGKVVEYLITNYQLDDGWARVD